MLKVQSSFLTNHPSQTQLLMHPPFIRLGFGQRDVLSFLVPFTPPFLLWAAEVCSFDDADSCELCSAQTHIILFCPIPCSKVDWRKMGVLYTVFRTAWTPEYRCQDPCQKLSLWPLLDSFRLSKMALPKITKLGGGRGINLLLLPIPAVPTVNLGVRSIADK